jgi:hypothetical protein
VLAGGASDGDWNTWCIYCSGASSEFWDSGTSEASGDAGSHDINGLTLGATFGPGNYWIGYILACLLFPSALSDADKNTVGQWYEKNYGIAWTDI